MNFISAADSSFDEIKDRMERGKNLRTFGVEFLDHATEGIVDDDFIVLAADSGVGKTELCCNIALANIEKGRRVHYIPLEAGKYEIERRLKFQMVAKKYYGSPNRPWLPTELTFRRWNRGLFIEYMPGIEGDVAEEFASKYKDLFLCYKDQKFSRTDLIEQVVCGAETSDLIILDHVHMMDWDDTDNKAIKEIAITCRDLALTQRKPIIAAAHIRKKERLNTELCPGKEELHGSSDLYKTSTVTITLSSGGIAPDGDCETYMRLPKCREEGSVTRYMGRGFYSPKKRSYLAGYKIGYANCTTKDGFKEIDRDLYPSWATPTDAG